MKHGGIAQGTKAHLLSMQSLRGTLVVGVLAVVLTSITRLLRPRVLGLGNMRMVEADKRMALYCRTHRALAEGLPRVTGEPRATGGGAMHGRGRGRHVVRWRIPGRMGREGRMGRGGRMELGESAWD